MSKAPTKPCGVDNNRVVINCDNSQECFATQEKPICSNIIDASSSWKLNPNVFPPLEYIGNKIGKKDKDSCELFNFTLWTKENIDWLLTFFYQNWNSNNNTTFPLGSFVSPLNSIGSCVEGLYCEIGEVSRKCRKKLNQLDECTSSNQCLSMLCGDQATTKSADGSILFTGACRDDDFTAYNQLKGNRTFNVIDNGNNNHDDDARNSSGSMAVVIIIIVILFASMAIYGYARRMFKKRDIDNDIRFLRREIDPETGEIVTVNTLSGRVRRGASILLNRGGSLNRTNSIRTLPPYTVVDEDNPPPSGIVSTITQYFFPPGELPPPYDSVIENENENNNTMPGVTLDEVREGVIIEGNNNNNNNSNNNNSNNNNNDDDNATSRRSSTSSREDVNDSRELNTMPEVSLDSEVDKEREGEREGEKEGEKEGEREGEREGEKEGEKEGEREGEKEEEREGEKEEESDTTVLVDNST